MTRVLVDDPDLGRQLMAARTPVEICDASGLVLGCFMPQVLAEDGPPLTQEPAPQRSGANSDDAFWKSVGID